MRSVARLASQLLISTRNKFFDSNLSYSIQNQQDTLKKPELNPFSLNALFRIEVSQSWVYKLMNL
jgi:hypothetical protein